MGFKNRHLYIQSTWFLSWPIIRKIILELIMLIMILPIMILPWMIKKLLTINNVDKNNVVINDSTTPERLEDFQVLKLVGKGGFAKVYQVRKIDSSEIFAMKEVRRDGEEKSEVNILSELDHPFIVHLRYSFQTKSRLFMVLDYVNGGELYFHCKKQGFFLEDVARVYAAEIVSAVSHLHARGIMHRDIKPRNILLDSEGHVSLTDFGLAKRFTETKPESSTFCGTPVYMAPEIILRKRYDRMVDWWSFGILLYEMLTGDVPFNGGKQAVKEKIVKKKIRLPAYLTSAAHSLLKGLLTKDPSRRLGRKGSEEIKRHKWFGCIDWKKLEARQIRPSFVPVVAGKECTANFKELRLTNDADLAISETTTQETLPVRQDAVTMLLKMILN